MSGRRDPRGPRLRTRILGAMALVVIAGAGTLIVASLMLAPPIFYYHLQQAGLAQNDALATHVDEGFVAAIVVSTLGGVGIAGAVAAAMAALVSRRISRPVSIAAAATTRLASGDYSARVPSPRMGPELDSLADAVNSLAERLEATEGTRIRLMSDLAHELRTPLAAIDATVEAITDGVLAADEQTLATLTANAQRLSRLVEDVASVSRAEERSFRLTISEQDLAELARLAIASTSALLTSKAVDITAPTGPGPLVRIDRDRILEVIGQLLANALNACSAGDRIAVEVRAQGPAAVLTVSDTGTGFAPGDAERLFQRFFRASQAHSPRAGSGIGLTIARSLTEAHGGTLTAASAGPGTGAAFTLTLPRAH